MIFLSESVTPQEKELMEEDPENKEKLLPVCRFIGNCIQVSSYNKTPLNI